MPVEEGAQLEEPFSHFFCSVGGEQLGSSQVQTEVSRVRAAKGTNGKGALEAGQLTMNWGAVSG